MDDANTLKTDAIHEDDKLIQDRTVVAAFKDVATAEQARDALVATGYKHVDVTTADAVDGSKPVHEHGFWAGLKEMFGGHHDAPVLGEAVVRGHSLVTVHTEQGRAAGAVDILDGFAPVEITGAEQAWTDKSSDPIASPTFAETDIVPTPDTVIAGEGFGVIEEDLLVIERDVNQSNPRVRSYSRNLPMVVENRDRGMSASADEDDLGADAIKRAD